jgi:uncharacterized protein YxjI
MRYRIRQKLLSLGNDFAVTDEHGAVVLRFDGHAFSFADKLTLLDADGATIGLLRKRQVYDLYKGDTLFASISKDLRSMGWGGCRWLRLGSAGRPCGACVSRGRRP